MVEQIKRIVLNLFPELRGRYHLPRFARVVSVSDAPAAGGVTDAYRPRYAVNVQVMLQNGKPDPALPVFEDLPLPAMAAGIERGHFGFPEPGTLVEVGFAYGSPQHPFIRCVLSQHISMAELAAGDELHQAAPGVYDRTRANGDKERITHGNITDTCNAHRIEAADLVRVIQNAVALVSEHSTEQVGGIKTIEGIGAIKLLSGGVLNLAALDNLNLTTATDLNVSVGRNQITRRAGNDDTVTAGGRTHQVVGDEVLTTDGSYSHSVIGPLLVQCDDAIETVAALANRVKVEDGGKIFIGQADNMLKVLADLAGVVKDLATEVASHSHPSNGAPPTTATNFTAKASQAQGLKGKADAVAE